MRFADFLFYLLLFTALLAPGYILGKLGRLEEHAMKSMSNLLTDVALPFLVLSNLLKTIPSWKEICAERAEAAKKIAENSGK